MFFPSNLPRSTSPLLPIEKDEEMGGGGERGKVEISCWFDVSWVITNSIISSCLFALGASHATSVILFSSVSSLYSFKDTGLSTAKTPSCSTEYTSCTPSMPIIVCGNDT